MTQLKENHINSKLLPQRLNPQSEQAQDSQNIKRKETPQPEFDQPVILRRSPLFSRLALWTLLSVTSFTILWAAVFRIDEAIPAQGKLSPQGTVREVQVPVNGMVQNVYVEDGDRVKKGDLLLRLDPTGSKAQMVSAKQIRNALMQENQFYRSQLTGSESTAGLVKIPEEMAQLTKSRKALQAENRLYRIQLSGKTDNANLSPEERMRLLSYTDELRSRSNAIKLEGGQLEQQLAQAQAQLSNAKSVLEVNQSILNDLEPLYREGAIAKLQYRQQKQEVLNRQSQVSQLTNEIQRLKLAIAQKGQELQNTISTTAKDILTRMAENDKKIAEIDSQLNKAIVENQKRIAELNGQIAQTQLTLDYQEVRAPVDGVVFDMKAKNVGYVANTTEPVLKVVPEQTLTAEVFLTNKDIGFVQEGMPVDIRIDSFPFSEFGDIKGELTSIGKDALPPDEIHPYYRFPATVSLDSQTLSADGKTLPLQSGMSITANIKVRDRTIMSIFTDKFTTTVESLKYVR